MLCILIFDVVWRLPPGNNCGDLFGLRRFGKRRNLQRYDQRRGWEKYEEKCYAACRIYTLHTVQYSCVRFICYLFSYTHLRIALQVASRQILANPSFVPCVHILFIAVLPPPLQGNFFYLNLQGLSPKHVFLCLTETAMQREEEEKAP